MTRQDFSCWFVDYPSTHRLAGNTVEVTPVSVVESYANDVERLRQALIPFAFIGRKSMEPLGLAEEYDLARDLLGLEATTERVER